MKKVSALYGDGGTGKTTLAFQLMVASLPGANFSAATCATGAYSL